MISHPALPSIIRELERHRDVIRLKKLLIYTIKNTWESDTAHLQSIALRPILLELPQQFPTILDLRKALYAAVNTLSRPQAYKRLADILMRILHPLYVKPANGDDPEGTTHVVVTSPQLNVNQSRDQDLDKKLAAVAKTLEQHREGIRIKKLLFTLCHKYWENDLQVLKCVSFISLVQRIQRLYASPYKLAAALQNLVDSLNRRDTYAPLGTFIIEASSPLYQQFDAPRGFTKPTIPPITVARPDAKPPNYAGDYKGFMSLNAKSPQLRSQPTNVDFSRKNLPDGAPAFVEKMDSRLQRAESFGDGANKAEAKGNQQSEQDAELQQPHFADALDIVELKIEIMKYANPLRIKILLFSVVHRPFDLTGRDWSLLRACDFDDLLHKTIQASPTVIDLELRLAAIAQSLFEPDEHLAAIAGLIQAVKLLSQSV